MAITSILDRFAKFFFQRYREH